MMRQPLLIEYFFEFSCCDAILRRSGVPFCRFLLQQVKQKQNRRYSTAEIFLDMIVPSHSDVRTGKYFRTKFGMVGKVS